MSQLTVIVGRTCAECGGEYGVLVLDREATEQDDRDVRSALGGMFCIGTHTFKVEVGKIETYKPDF